MPALQVNDAGIWRTATKGVFVNDAGTWRTIKTAYVNDAGVWRTVYQNVVISLPASIDISRTNGSPAQFILSSDGNLYRDSNGSLTVIQPWITDVAQVGQYNCLMTVNSGTFSTGTTGSALACSSTPGWTVSAGAGQVKTVTFTFSIIRISDSVTVASCPGTLQVDRT